MVDDMQIMILCAGSIGMAREALVAKLKPNVYGALSHHEVLRRIRQVWAEDVESLEVFCAMILVRC